jgi:NhaP-type Na+/H+ or K+/H+ antiporter
VLAQVGADEKLSSVIDGESLVNDGSALVIFLVLQQFVQGASLSAGQVRAQAFFLRASSEGIQQS